MLTVPVLVWPGRTFFTGAAAALRGRRLTMDVPVALGLSIAFTRKRIRDGHRQRRGVVRLGGDVRHPAERRPVPRTAGPTPGHRRDPCSRAALPRSSRPECVESQTDGATVGNAGKGSENDAQARCCHPGLSLQPGGETANDGDPHRARGRGRTRRHRKGCRGWRQCRKRYRLHQWRRRDRTNPGRRAPPWLSRAHPPW